MAAGSAVLSQRAWKSATVSTIVPSWTIMLIVVRPPPGPAGTLQTRPCRIGYGLSSTTMLTSIWHHGRRARGLALEVALLADEAQLRVCALGCAVRRSAALSTWWLRRGGEYCENELLRQQYLSTEHRSSVTTNLKIKPTMKPTARSTFRKNATCLNE